MTLEVVVLHDVLVPHDFVVGNWHVPRKQRNSCEAQGYSRTEEVYEESNAICPDDQRECEARWSGCHGSDNAI